MTPKQFTAITNNPVVSWNGRLVSLSLEGEPAMWKIGADGWPNLVGLETGIAHEYTYMGVGKLMRELSAEEIVSDWLARKLSARHYFQTGRAGNAMDNEMMAAELWLKMTEDQQQRAQSLL